MNKKRIVMILLLIILIFIIVFLGFTIRKMIIIKDLNQKVSEYMNSNNHYEKIINNSNETETITEYYCKGENAVTFLKTTIKSTGETRKLMNYYNGEKVNTYIETGENKIAILDSNGLPSKIMIIGFDYGNNIFNLFMQAITSSIKSIEYNGKDCYLFNSKMADECYIEKETGLILRAKYGTEVSENGNKSGIIVEYFYEFNNVDDSIFVEPDISEYTIQEKQN